MAEIAAICGGKAAEEKGPMMVEKTRVMLNDGQVRHVKRLLIAKHTVANVARFYNQSPETISRIKRGATHRDVKVEGEEVLRPANPLDEVPIGQTVPRGLSELDAENANATLERLLAVQEEMAGTADTDPVREAKAQVEAMQREKQPVEQLSAAEFRRRVEEGEL